MFLVDQNKIFEELISSEKSHNEEVFDGAKTTHVSTESREPVETIKSKEPAEPTKQQEQVELTKSQRELPKPSKTVRISMETNKPQKPSEPNKTASKPQEITKKPQESFEKIKTVLKLNPTKAVRNQAVSNSVEELVQEDRETTTKPTIKKIEQPIETTQQPKPNATDSGYISNEEELGDAVKNIRDTGLVDLGESSATRIVSDWIFLTFPLVFCIFA